MKIPIVLIAITFTIQCSKKPDKETQIIIKNNWRLESLSGFSGKLEGNKGFPILRINMADTSYSGHSGCNNYHGKLNVSGKGYIFSPGLMTKMYCDDGGLENAYMNVLHSVSNYALENEKLILSNSKGVKATFVMGK